MKALEKLSNEALWHLFPIRLQSYQPHWALDFSEEKEHLMSVLRALDVVRIRHIGSTAVPGLLAKPIIDILLEVAPSSDLQLLQGTMVESGYIYSPQANKPAPHMMFLKGYTPKGFAENVFHVHVRYPGDWEEIRFRNYLRTHPAVADAYAQLKRKLQYEFEYNRDAYTEAKTAFVAKYSECSGCVDGIEILNDME